MNLASLPKELREVIGEEAVDFFVETKRKNGFSYVPIFGIFFLLPFTFFAGKAVMGLFVPLFLAGEVSIGVNDVPRMVGLENLILVTPLLFISSLSFFGFFYAVSAIIHTIFQKGGFFVGTSKRLISYRKGKITAIDWGLFSGKINLNDKKELGNLILNLRIGNVSSDESGDEFTPEVIEIIGVEDIYQIEKYCLKRIEENRKERGSIVRTYRSYSSTT